VSDVLDKFYLSLYDAFIERLGRGGLVLGC
jgi:hypothetical protein